MTVGTDDHQYPQILNICRDACHAAARSAGWYNDPQTGHTITRNVPEMLALIHSEVSEMLEGYRKRKMDDHLPHRLAIEVEAADVLIRMFDLSGYLGLDLDAAVAEKMAYNALREDHKLMNRVKPGGKAF